MSFQKKIKNFVFLVGIAIVQGMDSSLGGYEYSCNGGSSWIRVNVSNTKPLNGLETISVLYLKPSDKIKFQMEDDQYWTTIQGKLFLNRAILILNDYL